MTARPDRLCIGLPKRIAFWCYGVLTRLLQRPLRRRLAKRATQEPLYGQHVSERFGFYGDVPPGEGYVWVHAVSLGETRAAAILLPALRQAWPGMRLLLTHGTATGRLQGRGLLQPGDVQVWFPWDTPDATRRFLCHFQPKVGLLIETEVWPQLVYASSQAGVPLCLVNARMSEKSYRRARQWAWLSKPAYGGLHVVLAQSQGDAARLRNLGCRDVRVTGNLKFDAQVPHQARELAALWQPAMTGRLVVMLASTREEEEAMWLQALQADSDRWNRLNDSGVLWLLVPRHPQRFDEVHGMLQSAGLRCVRRSTWMENQLQPASLQHVDVVLGDSLGEMSAYYLVSRVALLGGSFAPLGGQNLIEAAACGCPVVMGPFTFNFAEAATLALKVGAATQAQDMQAALDEVCRSLVAPGKLEHSQTAAREMLRQGQGAVARHVQQLGQIVSVTQEEERHDR